MLPPRASALKTEVHELLGPPNRHGCSSFRVSLAFRELLWNLPVSPLVYVSLSGSYYLQWCDPLWTGAKSSS